MPHGGSRPGAGRKTNAELQALRAVIDEIVSDADWESIVTLLFDLAKKGNFRATQILFTYRFGDPYASEPSPEERPAISTVLVERGGKPQKEFIQIIE